MGEVADICLPRVIEDVVRKASLQSAYIFIQRVSQLDPLSNGRRRAYLREASVTQEERGMSTR